MKIYYKILIYLLCLPICLTAQTNLVVAEGNLVAAEGYLVLNDSRLINNATIASSEGAVKMTGYAPEKITNISGEGTTTFNELIISKSQGDVSLRQDITITSKLKLEGGKLDIKDSDVFFYAVTDFATLGEGAAASATGGSSDRYVKTSGLGQFKTIVGTIERSYPIGNSSYNPLKMSNENGFEVVGTRVEDQVRTDLDQGTTYDKASVNRVWHIEEDNPGSANLMVNFQWSTEDELRGFDRSNSQLIAFEGGDWVSQNSGSALGNGPFNFSATSIGSGAFSVASEYCNVDGSTAILSLVPPMVGNDQLALCGETAPISAIVPAGSAGQWTFTAQTGGGGIVDPGESTTEMEGLFGGQYTMRWTVIGGACDAVFDELDISFSPDEDIPGGDGVQDCVDNCLGGDNRINSDGAGAPDDCDCDPNNASTEFVELDAATFAADIQNVINTQNTDEYLRTEDFELSSDAVIDAFVANNYPKVTFQAGSSITLTEGFVAKAGSEFTARIGPCKDPTVVDGIDDLAINRSIAEELLANTPLSEQLNLQVFPNIIQEQASILIELPTAQPISLNLFNNNGQLVNIYLDNEFRMDGKHYFRLKSENLDNGFYFLQLVGEGDLLTKKLLINH